MTEDPELTAARETMIQAELVGKGITDPRVIAAMRMIPRHRFVPPELVSEAYGPHALPIGSGQTISAPQMVALMTEALQVEEGLRVLEVGTGSGYQTAILATLGARVSSIERLPQLAEPARRRLADQALSAEVHVGDGSVGDPCAVPFDRILITAATPRVPRSLLSQLAAEGILVAPVGGRAEQILTRVVRHRNRFEEEALCRCVFVPLLGEEGFEG